ncbi:tetratricopeptide repeat protein [Neolewinella lacunae]|uniref:Tetratricopeptide repeat protein n=1 Tax=Neolewinella lacunae TaxID=1517758 RepID=A0A923T6G4_9BACT|nr:tetratricopeptide repeat protein [Neolewinella lacunae]MBC6992576.1 tetratricopeptide repeat protein [Neolewinella lacunae]MDN3634317.1 tetratricopeptide repeat protein [Neolewinella lacunae]
MTNEENYLRIEAYLQGELDATERAAVEALAERDADFARALAERRALASHLRAEAGADALRFTLADLGAKYFPSEAKTARLPRPRRQWLALAAVAVVVLVLTLGGIAWWPAGAANYADFARHEPLALVERGAADQLPSRAEAAYNAGEFEQAIPLLESYLEEHPADERARLALGVSLLERNRDQEAVDIFTAIAAGKSSLAAYGNWYLALAAVKRGESAAAEAFLRRIPTSESYLKAQVERLRAAL